MYTIGNLFPRLCDPDFLDECANLATSGKKRRPDVAWFLFRREEELLHTQAQLADGTWLPADFEPRWLRDPKPRVIARAPVSDRVVHTALVKLMEPVLIRPLTDDCYACRPGMGTHRAVLRLMSLMQRHRFALHLPT